MEGATGGSSGLEMRSVSGTGSLRVGVPSSITLPEVDRVTGEEEEKKIVQVCGM